MLFNETSIKDLYVIDLEKKYDERGYFARTFCTYEFEAQGVKFSPIQSNMSFSKLKGTLRGLHYQVPTEEAKLVRCPRGKIFDVVIDMRADSESYLKISCNELASTTSQLLYVPPGCAHGFLTLENNTEVNYLVNALFNPAQERGIRYNDPAFNIPWPSEITIISEKDKSFADYDVQNKI
ncbi:dTDP-4-dehydrorhamnose 3,5-epimerase [Algoriphagus sp. AGSA1]|uniref:dTDP-4-dehydrorhamnose 3,5-epimerase n=1 Tax=Algoriphagus sp. AGSA1 TaxID=2907213 RepID=UPI001F3CA4CF|nr:dTDP-4-dehydrorhamnose 3,5-epimerase [Algoriphagus sp. AGSA1]MCE7053278.1 dTDP-4-dehydrorhamnose 3,5-epimerase [Algoriphagus sp. AGSA1]